MPRVVIQPCSNPDAQKHYEDTVANPVPMELLERYLPRETTAALRAQFGNRSVPTWGATPGKRDTNVSQWDALSPGDTALFTRDKRAHATATVALKARSARLAERLWGRTDDGESTWEYLYFLDGLTAVDIPYPDIRDAAALADGWNPLRFWVMDDAKSAGVLALLAERGIAPADSELTPELVQSVADVHANVQTFNAEAPTADPDRVRTVLKATSYWVYDPAVDLFAPSKFSGLRAVSLEEYFERQDVAREAGRASTFDGSRSKTAIERAIGGRFAPTPELMPRLESWATDMLGTWPFGGVDRTKWEFMTVGSAAASRERRASGSPSSAPDLAAALREAAAAGDFRLEDVVDAREKVLRAVARRRGQPGFRKLLLAAYGNRCTITGCDAPAALEAAHIVAYQGPATNHLTNGLLLRSDIHTLFDLGLLAIDPDELTVRIAPELRGSSYAPLHGRTIVVPEDPRLCPSRECLRQQLAASRVVA